MDPANSPNNLQPRNVTCNARSLEPTAAPARASSPSLASAQQHATFGFTVAVNNTLPPHNLMPRNGLARNHMANSGLTAVFDVPTDLPDNAAVAAAAPMESSIFTTSAGSSNVQEAVKLLQVYHAAAAAATSGSSTAMEGVVQEDAKCKSTAAPLKNWSLNTLSLSGLASEVTPMSEFCESTEGAGTTIDYSILAMSPSLTEMPPNLSPPYNWQSSKNSVKERMAYMYTNHVMADVLFLVGKEARRVYAHKFVLSVSSAVFDAQFNRALSQPTAEAAREEVHIPDVEPAAFLALLKFIYSDEVHIGPDSVMTTLYAAKKYAVSALERACVDFLKKNLSCENAFMLLSQARLFDEAQLASLCLEVIDKNTGDALNSDCFVEVDLDTLCAVLERDTLGIRECKLFGAIIRWAEAECIRRRCVPSNPEALRCALGRALYLIRFPLMNIEEFANCVAVSGVLTDREVVQMFLYFFINPKPQIGFLDVPRCCLTGKEQVVSRFCAVEQRWGYSGTSDRIRFMVNRKIFVVGFGLYGSIHGPAEYQVKVEIVHSDSNRVMGVKDTNFQCDGSNSTFRVIFKEPVEVQPNDNYMACATLKGPDSYYGTKGLRKITHESVTNGKVTFQFTYAAGNNNGTSVEDGQIPDIIFYL